MVIRFVVLHILICGLLFGPQICVFARRFLKVSATCLRTAKTLARLRFCISVNVNAYGIALEKTVFTNNAHNVLICLFLHESRRAVT